MVSSTVRELIASMQIFENLYDCSNTSNFILRVFGLSFQLFLNILQSQASEMPLFQFAHKLFISECTRYVTWNVCESDFPYTQLDWKYSYMFLYVSFQYHSFKLNNTPPSRDRPSQLHSQDAARSSRARNSTGRKKSSAKLRRKKTSSACTFTIIHVSEGSGSGSGSRFWSEDTSGSNFFRRRLFLAFSVLSTERRQSLSGQKSS